MKEILGIYLSGDIKSLVETLGLVGVYILTFSETGLLTGFFLPGDSLLFIAGLLASPAISLFKIWPLVLGSWVAALLGDNVGYEFGKGAGKKLFKKEKSIFFKPGNLLMLQAFYKKHGPKIITLARFIPVVRTLAPILAGIGHMDRKKFTIYNFIGVTLWVWTIILIGYYYGSLIPYDKIELYLLPIIFVIILLSLLPSLINIYKENNKTWYQKLSERLIVWFKYKI